jgi:hypothetical protein
MKQHLKTYWFFKSYEFKHFQKARLVKLHKVVFLGVLFGKNVLIKTLSLLLYIISTNLP